MPEFGQVRNLDGQTHVFLLMTDPRGIIRASWVSLSRAPEGLREQIAALPTGTIIDPQVLTAQWEVVVVGEPPVVLSDDAFDWLLREAEAMGGGEG